MAEILKVLNSKTLMSAQIFVFSIWNLNILEIRSECSKDYMISYLLPSVNVCLKTTSPTLYSEIEMLLIVHAKIENWSSETVQGIHYYDLY